VKNVQKKGHKFLRIVLHKIFETRFFHSHKVLNS